MIIDPWKDLLFFHTNGGPSSTTPGTAVEFIICHYPSIFLSGVQPYHYQVESAIYWDVFV